MNIRREQTIQCYITAAHDCSYLAGQTASNLVIDPKLPLNDALLGELLNNGFRRSGDHVYRPQCQNCSECRSLRIPVAQFKVNRSQRRNWRSNHELQHNIANNNFKDEHFQLYQKYLNSRHQGSEMSNPSPDDFLGFLTAPGISSYFHEIHLHGKLLAVAVTDHTPLGLSAVYTFFDPEYEQLGLGIYAILLQIELSKQLKLPWLYLGYWVKDCVKMRYKSHYRPFEAFIDREWRFIEK